MRHLIAGLILAISILSSVGRADNRAYVVNNLAETLSMIDLETGAVDNQAAILGETPNQAVVYDGYLYVVNSVSANILKFDKETLQLTADIPLPIGSNPYFADFHGNYGYVTGWVSGKVYRVNLASNTVDREVETGRYPEGILYDGGRIYVTRTNFNPNDFSYGQGDIAVINASSFEIEGYHNVGINPQWISKSPDDRLHVVCTGNYVNIEGSVHIYDLASGQMVDTVAIGGQPGQLAISALGIGYLAAGGWFESGMIFSYDIFSGQVLRGPSNPISAGLGVTSVGVDGRGFIYSCDFGDDTVTKLDPSGQIIRGFGLGDGPISIAIDDDVVIGTDPEDITELPDKPTLMENYPNPFNGGTVIAYRGAKGWNEDSFIEIYDIGGKLIIKLKSETLAAPGMVYWDGRGRDSEFCPSGVYFARISDRGNGSKVLKMTILR